MLGNFVVLSIFLAILLSNINSQASALSVKASLSAREYQRVVMRRRFTLADGDLAAFNLSSWGCGPCKIYLQLDRLRAHVLTRPPANDPVPGSPTAPLRRMASRRSPGSPLSPLHATEYTPAKTDHVIDTLWRQRPQARAVASKSSIHIQHNDTEEEVILLVGNSCFCFGSDSRARQALVSAVHQQWFERLTMALILFTIVALVFDDSYASEVRSCQTAACEADVRSAKGAVRLSLCSVACGSVVVRGGGGDDDAS
jgi:hypothetical protein